MSNHFSRLRRLGLYVMNLSWLQRLWLLAPLFIWFSYLPTISLGGDGTMNFELSLTLIYAVALAIVGLPTVWRGRRKLLGSGLVWLVTVLVGWSCLTAVWSANSMRGVLTAGVLGIIYLIFLATQADWHNLRSMLPILAKLLIGTAVVACLLALVQMVVGTYLESTASRDSLGLCAGCVAGQFGFVRPNLFAIEPQFLGSLLIAPILICFYGLIRGKRRGVKAVIFILLLTTLGLTLSRGAIYACVIGLIIVAITVRGCWLRKLATVDLIVVSAVLCLSIQGGLAAVNPYIQETFWGAVTKSINHLSLGLIDLAGDQKNQAGDNQLETSPSTTSPADDQQKPAYDGYVAESTDVRLNLTKTALVAWSNQDLTHRLFGSGLGSAGVIMAQQTGSSYQKEIVQNEYAEILLERGVVGLLLTIVVIVALLYRLRHHKWLWGIVLAYLVQYCFFSGLPNALHIYLVLCWLPLYRPVAGKDLPDGLK